MPFAVPPPLVEKIFWAVFSLEFLMAIGMGVYVLLPTTRWGPEGPVGAWLVFVPPILLSIALAVFLLSKSDSTKLTITVFLTMPLLQMALGPLYTVVKDYQRARSRAGDDDFRGPQRKLAHAIHKHDLAEVKRLIPLSGDLSREYNTETLLRFALVNVERTGTAAENSAAIVKALLDQGGDPNVPAAGSNWPLTLAMSYGPAMTARLLDAGADPNRLDGARRPLWWDVLSDAERTPTLEVLLAHGANVNLRDSEGGPAAWAAYHKNWAAVELLIRHGAPWKDEQEFGQTIAQMLQSDLHYRNTYSYEIPKEMKALVERYGLR